MANYQYCVAKNWGKGFITPKDTTLEFTGAQVGTQTITTT
mgnify:CR=1 FL=1